jgi:hypothetical protein
MRCGLLLEYETAFAMVRGVFQMLMVHRVHCLLIKTMNIFATDIDVTYLNQVQRHTAELACCVINTVISNGIAFPGVPNTNI